MKFKYILPLFVLALYACSTEKEQVLEVKSPNSEIAVNFNVNAKGKPFYTVMFNNKTVVDTSYLGFDFKDAEDFGENFKIKHTATSSFNENWQMPWGEQLDVVNNYNELKVELQENNESARLMNIVFKVYDDGIGFRFE